MCTNEQNAIKCNLGADIVCGMFAMLCGFFGAAVINHRRKPQGDGGLAELGRRTQLMSGPSSPWTILN